VGLEEFVSATFDFIARGAQFGLEVLDAVGRHGSREARFVECLGLGHGAVPP
jgi:hypothetical protein